MSLEAREILKGCPPSMLKIFGHWLEVHMRDRDDNLLHAKAHAAAVLDGVEPVGASFARANAYREADLAAVDSMVTHYTGELSALHCLMSDIEAELNAQAMAARRRQEVD